MCLKYKSFENAVRKEIARSEQFLFFPVFFYQFEELSAILIEVKFWTVNSLSLEESKICCLEKG